jgi:hypothetical protein
MTKRIGFIGVGRMGHGLAKNLVEKGFPLTILGHPGRQPVQDLVSRGAKEAKDVAMKFGLANAAKEMCYHSSMAMENGISGPKATATMQTLLAAMNLGFGAPEYLTGSLVEAQAKITASLSQ